MVERRVKIKQKQNQNQNEQRRKELGCPFDEERRSMKICGGDRYNENVWSVRISTVTGGRERPHLS